MPTTPTPKGKSLIAHLVAKHGFSPLVAMHKVNSNEYKRLIWSHQNEYHGRWQDQEDHTHTF